MKYSHLKKHVALEKGRSFAEGSAALTHYWQGYGDSSSGVYEDAALDYYNTVAEPGFQYELPLKYDVPFPPVKKPEFTFIDLFAGIGGFRLAFQEQKGKCVFSSEWDKYAQKTYEANFGEVPFGDITKVDENLIADHDILLGGFPCQPFSLAGVSKKNSLGREHGFLDKTQGTLFFDIARIIDAKRPKAFLLENVKNLKSHDKGKTFKVITETLRELGYSVFTKVIDARHYVPQHRERVFIVGFSHAHFGTDMKFEFPIPPKKEQFFRDILESNPDPKYTLTDNLWQYLQEYAKKHRAKGNGFGFNMTDLDGVSRTLSARYHKDGAEILIPQGKGETPRRLTPNECKALMGYPQNYLIEGIGVSDTQLYRQFGNSVAVPVVKAIAKQLCACLKSSGSEERLTIETEKSNATRNESVGI